MGNVWSELRKQQNRKPSVWDQAKEANRKPVKKPDYQPEATNNVFPEGTITFDLETGSVLDMFKSQSASFIRLYAWDDGNGTYSSGDPSIVRHHILYGTGWVIGHNIINFDCLLLDRLEGLSILDLARQDRLRDTKLIAFLADPPYSRTSEGDIEKQYSLENVGLKYLGEGKTKDLETGKSVLKELAREFGGFDKIPVDHPLYNEYARRDVEITRDLCKVLPINDYTRREHKLNAICATISIQGFRVDVPLLNERIRQGEEKRNTILTNLQSYGLPAPGSSAAPHRTKAGIEAIDQAFTDLGVTLPRSEKSGRPSMGKPVLEEIVDKHEGEVVDLAEAIMSLNGIRTIYGNISDNLVGDRVHPAINLRQSSGRLSIQNPGLTVIGKRGGKVIERAVFLPDSPEHVLISADLSQVDARAVAGLSQDRAYLAMFEPGKDLHGEMAMTLFGTIEKREMAKPVAHGINYGMRPKKLAWTVGMDLWEAERVVAEFEKNFPRLTAWQYEVRQEGEVSGILYNGFGRLMRIERDRAFTQAPALMGQSTARDILMEGILNLWKAGGDQVIRMIRGIIHDELVLSVPKKDAEELRKLVVDSMTFEWCPVGKDYPVMIEAGVSPEKRIGGFNWADVYKKD